MNNKEIKLNKVPRFPDHLVPDEVKNTKEFGLKVALAIQDEWFYRPSDGNCQFKTLQDEYHNLRLYARGDQDSSLYKDLLTGGESSSYTNYDWRNLQIAPKFVNLITNQMSERLFEIRAEATDRFSTDLKDNYRKNLEDLVAIKPLAEEFSKELGIDMLPELEDGVEVPQSQEEIDLHMQLKYKPAIEVATEMAIKYTLDMNDFDETRNKIIEDLVVLGKAGIRRRLDPTRGIVIEYVDPAMVVHSYAKNRNFKDVHYYGIPERVTINELKRRANGEFTEDQLQDIFNTARAWSNYMGNNNEFSTDTQVNGKEMDNCMVDILHFTFQSTNTLTYKKKPLRNGGFKMTRKDSTFDKNPNYDNYDVSKKVIEVWYEGFLVMGTNYVFNYGLCKNQIRPKGLINKAIAPIALFATDLYQNKTKSLLGRVIPYLDQMQQIHIKLQQIIAKVRPSGIYIDIDGLSEIDMGNGNMFTPLEMVKYYDETGNIIGTNQTVEGSYNYGKQPIQELNNGVPKGLGELMNAYNHYLNLLRDAIGIPQGADASMPHPDTLVGVQQQVALNSNTATRHILESALYLCKETAIGVSLMMNDIFKYSNLKEAYLNAIGKLNLHVLESLKDYHLHDFGIHIELKPDIEEKQYLEQNIATALQGGLITIDDAIDIRLITNIRLANELLKIRRVKREREKRAHEKMLAETQSQAQIQAVQASAQAESQKIQMKSQADLALIEAEIKKDAMKIKAEAEAKSRLMQQEFEYNMTLKGVDTENLVLSNKYKEEEKTRRQDRQNSQASRIAEQKQKGESAIDFEKEAQITKADEDLLTNFGQGMPMESSTPPPTSDVTFESSEDNVSGAVEMGELEPS